MDQPLAKRHCRACEGGVDPLERSEAERMLAELQDWQITDDGKSICKKWMFKNFAKAMQFLVQTGEVAEQEQHHPDLHLTGYRHVRIELTTHAIGGLSENDFIIAARLDEVDKS